MSFVLFLASIIFSICFGQPYDQPLDNFIAAPDAFYSWNDTGLHETGVGWDAYLINMTSQMWLNATYVNHPIWWHWLWIVIPKELKHSGYASVLGTGGSNKKYDISGAPGREDIFFISCQNVARDTGSICASLYQIPNEPLIFLNDPTLKSRSEDSIIAYGWHQFSFYESTNDYRYNWLTHFPMVKATIRAMDTVAAFASEKLKIPTIEKFGVSGASKRGWSAWLTAAADKRIEVMIPIVMDMCNFHPNLHHQYKAYGGWTFAFKDYYAENITQDLDDQWFEELLQAADPYSFFDRYNERNIHKFMVDGTWDEFFMPDDEFFWWDELEQPKYFLMNPDADHSQATAVETDIPSLTTFMGAYLNDVTLPIIDWEIRNVTGNITVYFNGNTNNIIDVVLWHGRSCNGNNNTHRRDFRMLTLDNPCHCGVFDGDYCFNLESIFVPINGIQPTIMNETYAEYHVDAPDFPDDHWTAFMVGIKYHDDQIDDNELERIRKRKPNPLKRKNDGSFDELLENENNDGDESWFLVEYGSIVWTSQVSIVPQYFPFADCSGEECKGTLV